MNGGAFPLPISDILGKVYSKLRNPTIAKLFRYVGIAENAGYGMNKLARWKSLSGTKSTIESDRTSRHHHYCQPDYGPLISAIQRKSDGENDAKNDDVSVNGTINGTITDFEQIVLNLIAGNPGISAIQTTLNIVVKNKTSDEPFG